MASVGATVVGLLGGFGGPRTFVDAGNCTVAINQNGTRRSYDYDAGDAGVVSIFNNKKLSATKSFEEASKDNRRDALRISKYAALLPASCQKAAPAVMPKAGM
jgi:hypothetical protein